MSQGTVLIVKGDKEKIQVEADSSALPPTVIWRHQKENLKKCSLRGLEKRSDMQFISYPDQVLPAIQGYVLLTLESPELTQADRDKGLFLIDGTWRYAGVMERCLREKYPELYATLIPRSLPAHLRTACPRYQTMCPQPDQGLASIEALYAAYLLMGRPTDGLLDGYYWKEPFLTLNQWK